MKLFVRIKIFKSKLSFQDGSQLNKDTKSGVIFFFYIKCNETFEADTEVCIKKAYKSSQLDLDTQILEN